MNANEMAIQLSIGFKLRASKIKLVAKFVIKLFYVVSE